LFQTKLTNLLVEDDQLVGELLQAMELGNLLLGFAQGGGAGKTLIDRLTLDFASEAELRIMPGVIRTGTMTGRFAEPGRRSPKPRNSCNSRVRWASKAGMESGTRDASFLRVIILSESRLDPEKASSPDSYVAHLNII
jgi:hypothetical protein